MSQRWDLNPRPLPYQGSALPLSYFGLSKAYLQIIASTLSDKFIKKTET
jgi:hypothetical protein